MTALCNKRWITGSGKQLSFKEIANIISNYLKTENKIFIGSDSFASKKRICFVTAVCLVSPGVPAKYFFYREYTPSKKYHTLSSRITEEVRRSIETAEILSEDLSISPNNIELHLDVSPFGSSHKTSKFSDMLTGYVQGYGFSCKVKPNAWASQSVADRHSK
tara:strand:- start:6805 stop:7290 length:486 start_codon:yes stop_codon:yes gene_type:complete